MALPARWTKLDRHETQLRLVHSKARFRVVAAGRRSGKTERAKRRLVECCMDPPRVPSPTYIACAPTRDQAKRIYWDDLKALAPPQWIARISESELTIFFKTGARLIVVGLDKPQRIEGIALDGAVVDEIDECKRTVWDSSLRPALSTRGRPGWCWFIGRPKGRKLLFDLFNKGQCTDGWESFHWTSAEIIDPAEIEQAREDLDPRTFQQEYEAAFLAQSGLVYYAFDAAKHVRAAAAYDPTRVLVLCFDFNVQPGAAVACQELGLPPWDNPSGPRHAHTCVVGEVYIPTDSLTSEVCARFGRMFPGHRAPVHYYGDPSGGKRNTIVQSNDWDMVRDHLRLAFPDVRDRVARRAPPIVDSVNSVNARLLAASGAVRFAISPAAKQTIRDFEGVVWEEDKPDRDIDKADLSLTHWTDAVRYYIHEAHPCGSSFSSVGVS